MESLKKIGLQDYYYLDNDKIYNKNKGKYVKEVGKYRYRLKNQEGIYKSITMKEIYKRLWNKVFCIDNIKPLKNEKFKVIKDTNGNYEISNLGRIKSKVGNNAIIMKTYITYKGYERVQLHIEGNKYNKYIHCLVASAWLKQPKSLEYEIHHKDNNKLNNSVSNLEYLSKLEHHKIHEERRKKLENGEFSKSKDHHYWKIKR